MDQLACKETERGKRLDKEYGRRREIAISEKAGKTIQQREIFCRELALTPAKCERMSKASTYAAPEFSPEGVHSCEYIVHR
jgi:hypothetical protein